MKCFLQKGSKFTPKCPKLRLHTAFIKGVPFRKRRKNAVIYKMVQLNKM